MPKDAAALSFHEILAQKLANGTAVDHQSPGESSKVPPAEHPFEPGTSIPPFREWRVAPEVKRVYGPSSESRPFVHGAKPAQGANHGDPLPASESETPSASEPASNASKPRSESATVARPPRVVSLNKLTSSEHFALIGLYCLAKCELPTEVNERVIKRLYRQLVQQYHPDRHENLSKTKAAELVGVLDEARRHYEVVRKALKRQ